jgi:hypothetical protein
MAAPIILATLLAAEPPRQPIISGAQRDPVDECLIDRVQKYAGTDQLAVVLANRIALECAELLPQRSNGDCGIAQASCDAVQEESNERITELLRTYAYKMIVILRQMRH